MRVVIWKPTPPPRKNEWKSADYRIQFTMNGPPLVTCGVI